jgi:hypothetical protein
MLTLWAESWYRSSTPVPPRSVHLYHQGPGEMLDHMLITRNPLAHYRGSEIHNEMGGRMEFPTLSSRTSSDTIEAASRPASGSLAARGVLG